MMQPFPISLQFQIYLVFTIALAAGLVLAVGALALRWLGQHGCRQYIRDEGPQRHHEKAGTPTMGGLLFLPPALLVGLGMPMLIGNFSLSLVLLAGLILGFLLLGLADDVMMLRRGSNLGLRARHKLILQFILAAFFLFALSRTPYEGGLLRFPFSSYLLAIPGWVYYPFAAFLIVGASNSTNLSDGLDGLLAGLAAICAAAFVLLSVWLQRPDLAVFSCALLGGCLGFLFYNRHPARVFMGDVGSLALGAAFSGIAILLHVEIVFLLLGAVFFIESLSVIIQVISFKSTGKRVFKMSPLHHHFELSGWKETQVVRAFCGASLLITAGCLLGTYMGWGFG
ncbi:MAG: phospho-N-acetylmuramoyl-pentapeptide-transferase [Armatimonadetes bacterium]|nr:phospho-N-acetylmuramoyl-pentapeptide-transferase [Armatimonadota bacterium]NIM24703.1 phospho-N-acetylmuramoyl-pentapeptide-transferase [Armatimonadota bacterium]NIM68583.1 phospho-N-acetylmuramoyl-pentapeptide-transferase [Armatimonadota bacterium]NIM77100.1 phospho-N-acetylmuramoyl-pentapeptide-transferase [Armatimonadota bacterium]NIN06777.1 phospho-N-acetylmuramoyl-pentapeptide-transferase [Armatimonadota bacterium]